MSRVCLNIHHVEDVRFDRNSNAVSICLQRHIEFIDDEGRFLDKTEPVVINLFLHEPATERVLAQLGLQEEAVAKEGTSP